MKAATRLRFLHHPFHPRQDAFEALDHIEREARLGRGCAFELGLIGQDTTSWGRDIGDDRGLVGVLETIDRVLGESGGGWGRLMYAYPTDFTDEMIDATRLPNIVKYIDIPLQHMATPVLDLMRAGPPVSSRLSC